MDYITVRQTADKWGVSMRWVQKLIKDGRIRDTIRPGQEWLIHKDTVKPADKRIINGRKANDRTTDKNGEGK